MRTLLPFAGVLALTSMTFAQQVVLPTMFATTEAGTTANVWRAGTNRVQCFYDATNFGAPGLGVPITINAVEFRLAGALATAIVTYPSVEIYLQNSAVNFSTPSTTFSANRSVAFPTTPNFAGPVTTIAVPGTTPNGYFINIPLTTPFTWDPSTGVDLLMEIVILTAPTPLTANTINAGFNNPVHLCNSIRSVGSTTALTGLASPFAPVVRFTYTSDPNAAFNGYNGAGCYKLCRSFYEQFPGSTNDLTNKTITMVQNGSGGYTVTTSTGATIVPPTGAGLALLDDQVSPAQTLPFTFNYPGNPAGTTAVFVDSNGNIDLNVTAASQIGGGAAALIGGTCHRLSPSMQDLLPDGATNLNNVYVDTTSTPGQALFTWLNVPCFGAATPSTFQVALIDNGTNDSVEFRYVTLANDSTSNSGIAITGYSLGGASLDPGSSDLTAGVINTFTDQPPLALACTSRPVLGTNWNLNVQQTPATGVLGVEVFGLSDPNIPDLFFLGMPGCGLRSTLDSLNAYLPSGPNHPFFLPIPNDVALIGMTIYSTAGMWTIPAMNAFGVITANGAQGTIGL